MKISQATSIAITKKKPLSLKNLASGSFLVTETSIGADLRNTSIAPDKAAELSRIIILSHDAGIGKSQPAEVVLGAMIIRANSLAKGYSGFQKESLQTLVDMINSRIIPDIPCSGSLGASEDLDPLARLASAMQGNDVTVSFNKERMKAKKALELANISTFKPLAKEGLAMTNGTSFMTSMESIAIVKETHLLENIPSILPLFLDAAGAVDAVFSSPIQKARKQIGQTLVASILDNCLKDSSLIDRKSVQDDYCVRRIPQILGPKIEIFLEHIARVEAEPDTATDNPLIFKGKELSESLHSDRVLHFNGEQWTVLSGGNFHEEYLASIADSIATLNAKIILLLERQMNYMLNSFRNKQKLPIYLIADPSTAGLSSGYMITQYTGNDLVQKNASYGVSTRISNITSANESEDVVSYGSTACQHLLSQLSLAEDFLSIYQTIVMQAYSIARTQTKLNKNSYSERAFQMMSEQSSLSYPYTKEDSFTLSYEEGKKSFLGIGFREFLEYPLLNFRKNHAIKYPNFDHPINTAPTFNIH